MTRSTGEGRYGRKTTTRTKPREVKTTGEPMEQPKVPSQEEINALNLETLDYLVARLHEYRRREDMSKISVSVSETRPIKPVYPQEGGDHIGYVQKGPRVLTIVIQDFKFDGCIRAAGEAW
jgi:hypothetical protein